MRSRSSKQARPHIIAQSAVTLKCTCISRLRQKATLIFPVTAAHLKSNASRAQNAQGARHAVVPLRQCCIGRKPAHSVVDGMCVQALSAEKLEHGGQLQPWRWHRKARDAWCRHWSASRTVKVDARSLSSALCDRTLKLWQKATLIFPVVAAPLGP